MPLHNWGDLTTNEYVPDWPSRLGRWLSRGSGSRRLAWVSRRWALAVQHWPTAPETATVYVFKDETVGPGVVCYLDIGTPDDHARILETLKAHKVPRWVIKVADCLLVDLRLVTYQQTGIRPRLSPESHPVDLLQAHKGDVIIV